MFSKILRIRFVCSNLVRGTQSPRRPEFPGSTGHGLHARGPSSSKRETFPRHAGTPPMPRTVNTSRLQTNVCELHTGEDWQWESSPNTHPSRLFVTVGVPGL